MNDIVLYILNIYFKHYSFKQSLISYISVQPIDSACVHLFLCLLVEHKFLFKVL